MKLKSRFMLWLTYLDIFWYSYVFKDICRTWRVTYPDGKETRLLGYSEAKGCKEVFGGKMWVDYDNCYLRRVFN